MAIASVMKDDCYLRSLCRLVVCQYSSRKCCQLPTSNVVCASISRRKYSFATEDAVKTGRTGATFGDAGLAMEPESRPAEDFLLLDTGDLGGVSAPMPRREDTEVRLLICNFGVEEFVEARDCCEGILRKFAGDRRGDERCDGERVGE